MTCNRPNHPCIVLPWGIVCTAMWHTETYRYRCLWDIHTEGTGLRPVRSGVGGKDPCFHQQKASRGSALQVLVFPTPADMVCSRWPRTLR
jgi:hypothetical protein